MLVRRREGSKAVKAASQLPEGAGGGEEAGTGGEFMSHSKSQSHSHILFCLLGFCEHNSSFIVVEEVW